GFARQDGHCPGCRVRTDFVQEPSEQAECCHIQRVDLRAGSVEPQDRDFLAPFEFDHDEIRSISMAWAWPPAAQAVTSASSPSSCSRRLAAVVSRRAPVAPNGWPSESDPPQRLTLSSPTCAKRPSSPRLSRPKASESSAARTASTW